VKPRVLYQFYLVRWSHHSREMQSPMKGVQKNLRKTWPRMRNPSLEQCTNNATLHLGTSLANMLHYATLFDTRCQSGIDARVPQ